MKSFIPSVWLGAVAVEAEVPVEVEVPSGLDVEEDTCMCGDQAKACRWIEVECETGERGADSVCTAETVARDPKPELPDAEGEPS